MTRVRALAGVASISELATAGGSGEDEGRPAAPYSWRLRRHVGPLFVLAGPAALGPVIVREGVGSRDLPDANGARYRSAAGVWMAEPATAPAAAPRARGRPLGAGDANVLALAVAARSRTPAIPVSRTQWHPRPAAPLEPDSSPEDETSEPAIERLGGDSARPAHEAAPPGGDDRPLLRLYGPLRLERPDTSAPGLRSARGLIAYLALHRSPASLDELLEVLWPAQDPARTRPRLWKAKQRGHELLGDALERQGFSYALDRRGLRLDVVEVEHLSRTTAGLWELERAATLSSGEPLADVDYLFADGHRRRLQSIRADVLTRLARARLEAGRSGAALGAAEELIAADRFNEHGWRLAMEAEAALGARQAVIDRYRRLRRELDTELGLAPQAETRATYRRLLGQG